VASLFIAALVVVTLSAVAAPGVSERVSLSSGVQANSHSYAASLSADGRFVAFDSYSSNLVPGDTNNTPDVFVYDRQTGVTERVSVDSAGVQGDSYSMEPSISGDGRFVAFYSYASNLVTGDTNDDGDIFVHDRQTGITERVTVDSAGNEANDFTFPPNISADGRYVAFESWASNLVPGDTNAIGDVFVHDRQTGVTERVSVDSAGNQGNSESEGPALSADGRYVAIYSWASNLVPGDTNGDYDIFVHDRQTGATERVSVDSAGNEANESSYFTAIGADGRFVAFASRASNLVAGDDNGAADVFVHDRQTGSTERVSVDGSGDQGNGDSGQYGLGISGDGRFAIFRSVASNLVAGDSNGFADVFIHDRQTGMTAAVSVDSQCGQANGHSSYPAISSDGRLAGFNSLASNLVTDDTNHASDVFVHTLADADGGGLAALCRGDADNDGMPDTAEDSFPCLDPTVDDASLDPDGDVLTNLVETQIGTNPCVADSDGDGFDDGLETWVGTDPLATCPGVPGVDDAWPLDFNIDRAVNINDLLPEFKQDLGAIAPDPGYTPRYDLNLDGAINIDDLLPGFKQSFNSYCTP